MLREPEHGPPGDAPPNPQAINVQFLIAFIRQVIREMPSMDVYYLALSAAKHQFPLTSEQEQAFMNAILNETKSSPWPDGFF